jgi:hypothetical protein
MTVDECNTSGATGRATYEKEMEVDIYGTKAEALTELATYCGDEALGPAVARALGAPFGVTPSVRWEVANCDVRGLHDVEGVKAGTVLRVVAVLELMQQIVEAEQVESAIEHCRGRKLYFRRAITALAHKLELPALLAGREWKEFPQ